MKVLSAKLKAPWQVRLDEVELPDVPPVGWVRLRVEACGICGTDLTAAEQNSEWSPFGHEIAGEIEAIGAELHHLKVGQKVTVESSSFCGDCELCRAGRVDLCNKVPSFWTQPAMGFSQRMLVPARSVVPYEGLSAAVACLAEPAGVAFDMIKTAGIQGGDRVAVVGPGPIGLMAAALAVRGGASRVVVIGRPGNDARLAAAAAMGAEALTVDGDLSQQKNLSRAFEHVLLTAPVQLLPASLSLLTYGGELTYIGIGKGPGVISFDANDFHFRKLQLRSSFASPAIYYPQVLRLLRAGVIPGDAMISHRFSLKDIGAAMQLYRNKKSTTNKIVILPE